MLTEYEAQKLQLDMRQELDATPRVVLKCAAGVLFLVALALFGFETDPRHDVASDVASAPRAAR